MGETALFLVLLQDTRLESPKWTDPRSPISLSYPHGARRCFWKAPVVPVPASLLLVKALETSPKPMLCLDSLWPHEWDR